MKMYVNEYKEPLTKIIKVDVKDEETCFYVYVRDVDFKKAIELVNKATKDYYFDNDSNGSLYDLIEDNFYNNNLTGYKIDWEDPFDWVVEA